MIGVCLREFQSLFKSVKSVIIIVVFAGLSILAINILSSFSEMLVEFGIDNVYLAGVMIVIQLLGPIFVMSISHDVLNQECHNRSIRFIVTKISRDKVIIGKFLGISLFWMLCMLSAWMIAFAYTSHFDLQSLIQAYIFLSYFIALSIFLSTIIPKPTFTIFAGVLIGLSMPVIGLWSSLDETNPYIMIIGLLTPYVYFQNEQYAILPYVVIVLTIVLLMMTILLFRKRDL